MTQPTTAGDAYDAELIRALGDAIDRADPVPQHVMDYALQLGDLRGLVSIPQAGQFGRQWIKDNCDTGEEAGP